MSSPQSELQANANKSQKKEELKQPSPAENQPDESRQVDGNSSAVKHLSPPEALQYNPEWTPARRRLFSKWLPVTDGIPDNDPIIQRIMEHFQEGDLLMDEVARMFHRLPTGQGRKLFEQALERGINSIDNPPPELVALYAQLDRVPDWINLQQVDRGALVAANISPAGKAAGVFLNTIQTIQGGMVGAAVGATGRMQRDVLQRARESAEFWRHLPEPGGLQRFGIAFKNAVRVRLMHAQARLMLMKKWGDEWMQQYGNPIPNAGIVAGVPTFGVANLMYDMQFGRRFSRQDMEDIHIFWSYIGYILGGNEDILPRTPEEGMKILDFALSVSLPPSQYAEELNRVSNLLLDTLMNSFKFPIFDAQLKPYVLQALNGFYFYVGGDFLGKRITETTKPTLVGRWVPGAVKMMVLAANLERYVPGRAKRWERNRQGGDAFWANLNEQFDKLAKEKNDLRPTRFNAHDQSRASEIGEAWRG